MDNSAQKDKLRPNTKVSKYVDDKSFDNTPKLRDVFSKAEDEICSENINDLKKDDVKEINSFDLNQDKIIEFLKFLDEDYRTAEDIKKYLDLEIKSLYEENDFRHSYFEISAYLQSHRPQLKNDDIQERKPINENLRILKEEVVVCEDYINIRNKIFKLIDHCNLELSRFSYFEKVYWKSENAKEEFQNIKDDYQKLNKKRKGLEKRISALKDDLNSSKSEYIAILSILSALILAGVGGLSLLGNISSAIKDLSNYRFVFILTSFGFVLFNLSVAMIYLIARLIKRDLHTVCYSSKEGDCLKGTCNKNCCNIVKIEKRFPFIFWFNAIDLAIMALSLVMEYLVNKFFFADWAMILFAYLFVGVVIVLSVRASLSIKQ